MANFIAQCPACRTSFRIRPAQLQVAGGLVRCGACLKVFAGREHRISFKEELESRETPAAAPPLELVGPPEPAPGETIPPLIRESPAGGPHELLAELEDDEALGAVSHEELAGIGGQPIELNAPSGPPRRRRLGLYLAANLLLALLLAGQYLVWNFDRLVNDPRSRPAMALLCQYAGCDFPAFRDIAAIESEELSVRSHPANPEALLVNFIFRNNAELPQDFPLVELNFYDLGNRLLANRRFSPDEYLPENLRQLARMPPGTPVQVNLEILDPGDEAVNYGLAFRIR